MTPGLSKLTITAHVAFSVGWLGAVAAFLVLSIAGLASRDAEVVRGAYLSMNLISRFVIIPMCVAALATGLLQALFRYYWIVIKFSRLSIVLLLVVTTLGVYKPWGLTRYGRRKQQERHTAQQQPDSETPLGVKIFLGIIGLLVIVFVVLHLTGHGFENHGH